jgi:hypothetical protein
MKKRNSPTLKQLQAREDWAVKQMKKQNERNFTLCEDCKERPASRVYALPDANFMSLCQRCIEVRLLKDSDTSKDKEVFL